MKNLEKRYHEEMFYTDHNTRLAVARFSNDLSFVINSTSLIFENMMYSYFLTSLYYFSSEDTDNIEEMFLSLISWKKVFLVIKVFDNKGKLISSNTSIVFSIEDLLNLANEYDDMVSSVSYNYDYNISLVD